LKTNKLLIVFGLLCLTVSVTALDDYTIGDNLDFVVFVQNYTGVGYDPVSIQACNISIYVFNTTNLLVNQSPMTPNPPTYVHNYTWVNTTENLYQVVVECFYGVESGVVSYLVEVNASNCTNTTIYLGSGAYTMDDYLRVTSELPVANPPSAFDPNTLLIVVGGVLLGLFYFSNRPNRDAG